MFVKGKSGNPNGRPPAGGATSEKLRAEIMKACPELIATLMQAARNGDTAAAKLLLDRGMAPLKARDTPVYLGTLPDGLGDAARSVLDAVAEGRITPLQAQQILSGMGTITRIVEVEELQRRIEALEKSNEPEPIGPA